MHINSLLKTIKLSKEKQKGQPRNNREAILNDCLTAINSERVGTAYKPLTFIGLKLYVQHLPDQDLHILLELSNKSESFGRAFFGILNKRTKP